MLDMVTVLIGALTGLTGFVIASKMHPKHKLQTSIIKEYEEIMGGMRTELRRWKAKAKYYEKGAVPNTLADAEGLPAIEGILDNLPANYKALIAPFKGQILDIAKNNPELVEQAKGVLLQRLGQQKKQDPNGIDNYDEANAI